MTDLKDQILAAVENNDGPVSTLELAGQCDITIWKANQFCESLEARNKVVIERQTNGLNHVAEPDDQLVADGGGPPLRTCPDCGLIHRANEHCRDGDGDE